jgi:AraC-like DNA-binding protein
VDELQIIERNAMYLLNSYHNIPLFHISGRVISEEPFLHAQRMNNDYLLLIGMEGTLHLLIDNNPIDLAPHQMLLIPPFTQHRGRVPTANISYFWCHFSLPASSRWISDEEAHAFYEKMYSSETRQYQLIPEYFTLVNTSRAFILCQQILDYTSQVGRINGINRYLTATLLAELSNQASLPGDAQKESNKSLRFSQIAEWVRVNASRHITVSEIGSRFNYNPNYLSALFKKKTGMTILQYITTIRLDIAKEYLLLTDLTLHEIAQQIAINDAKYFMRLFKEKEGLTPTSFRNAYSHTPLQGHSSILPSTKRNVENSNLQAVIERARIEASAAEPSPQQLRRTYRIKHKKSKQDHIFHNFAYRCPSCQQVIFASGTANIQCVTCAVRFERM